jgi:very-short-patch-repair endonuclease
MLKILLTHYYQEGIFKMPSGIYKRTKQHCIILSDAQRRKYNSIRKYMNCLRCGKEFYITPSHPNRKYCSGECYDQRNGDRVEITCQVCGKKVLVAHCHRKQKFCSLNCNAKVCNKNRDYSYLIGENNTSKRIEVRKKISESNSGVLKSEGHKKKIGIASANRICKDSTREKLRISLVEYIKNKCGGIGPIQGKYEKQILDELQNKLGFSIKRQFYINGWFLDGYCQELNLAIEVDEEYHYENEKLRPKDIRKQCEIIKILNCNFIRIRVKDIIINDKIKLGDLYAQAINSA